jgi:hypothetical protein
LIDEFGFSVDFNGEGQILPGGRRPAGSHFENTFSMKYQPSSNEI